MCHVTAKSGFSGAISLVVLLKVVVCGTMLELVHRTMCALACDAAWADRICIIELQVLLQEQHDKPSNHKPQHEEKALSDGGVIAICLMH